MIMADVFAVFGTMLALGIALPGLLVAWRLLVPGVVIRAQTTDRANTVEMFFCGALLPDGQQSAADHSF